MQLKGFSTEWVRMCVLRLNQLLRWSSCTVCKQKAFLHYEPAYMSLQLRSTDGCVAALVATVGLLTIMLKHVRFEIFGHLEGKIALNTCKTFVFSRHFHCSLLTVFWFDQSVKKDGGLLKTAETI